MCYLFITVIGFGSVAFHGTLTYEGQERFFSPAQCHDVCNKPCYHLQIMDELPMLWGSLSFLFTVLADDSAAKVHHPRVV